MKHLAKLLADYDKKNVVKEGYYYEDDEFEFDLDLDPEDDDMENDGQPTDYEEWQDYMGGDDWDHGQFDEDDEFGGDEEPEFDDEEEFDGGDEEPEFDDEEDGEEPEFDFDDEDDELGGDEEPEFDDDATDTESRLDDLEDKLNTLLSKFAEVLATDIVDDEPEDDEFDADDEDGEEFDDEEGGDDEPELDDIEGDGDDDDFEEETVLAYADNLPDAGNPDDYDYENEPGADDYRVDYEGPVRSKTRQRRQRRWAQHRLTEDMPVEEIENQIEQVFHRYDTMVSNGQEGSKEGNRLVAWLDAAEKAYPEAMAAVIKDRYGE